MSEEFRSRRGRAGQIKERRRGCLVGFLMFVYAFPLLWWNEGRAVSTAQMLAEAKVGWSPSTGRRPCSSRGKLAHLQGEIAADQEVDSTWCEGQAPGAGAAGRDVSWTERVKTKEEQKVGGGTRKIKTHSYSKTWSKEAICRACSSDRRA